MPVPVPTPTPASDPAPDPAPAPAPAPAADAQVRDMAHAIQQGDPAPSAWYTPEQYNAAFGAHVQVHTGGSQQGVRILDPRVQARLQAGEDEEVYIR